MIGAIIVVGAVLCSANSTVQVGRAQKQPLDISGRQAKVTCNEMIELRETSEESSGAGASKGRQLVSKRKRRRRWKRSSGTRIRLRRSAIGREQSKKAAELEGSERLEEKLDSEKVGVAREQARVNKEKREEKTSESNKKKAKSQPEHHQLASEERALRNHNSHHQRREASPATGEQHLAPATNQTNTARSPASGLRQASNASVGSASPLIGGNSQEQQQQQQQVKLILITICLPILSCLMFSLLICYVWSYCRKLARLKRDQKPHKGRVSKLKSQAKSTLRGISILGGARGSEAGAPNGAMAQDRRSRHKRAFEKRQLTINMEQNELSSDDQSMNSSLGAEEAPTSKGKGVSLIDKIKFVASSRADTMGPAGKQSKEDKKGKKSYGQLKYRLSYDFQQALLSVSILEARELPPMDLCGTSDPYVKIQLLASPLVKTQTSEQPKNCFRTKIHKRTLNPVFNETFQIQLNYTELLQQSLQLSVFDYDRLSKHDEIGLVSVELNSLDWSQASEEQWAELSRPSSSQRGLDGRPLLGDICLSLRYVPTAGKLTVVVLEARKLKKMDLAGLSDPYVKLALVDERGKRVKKKKTSIKKCTLNPHYNESFSFEIPFELVQRVSLQVTVIDYDRIGTSEPIGRIILGCEQASGDTETRHWMDMLASPRRPIAQWHSLCPLTSERGQRTASSCSSGVETATSQASCDSPTASATETPPAAAAQH